jgi:hypothetical protein
MVEMRLHTFRPSFDLLDARLVLSGDGTGSAVGAVLGSAQVLSGQTIQGPMPGDEIDLVGSMSATITTPSQDYDPTQPPIDIFASASQ